MIYDLVGADEKDTFVFTPSGAEAINQVHWTAFLDIARKEGKCHFITSTMEDAPVLQSLKRLEELGCYVKAAPMDEKGRIDVAKLAELIGPRTAMISISSAQGLTGVIQPIDEIAALAKEKGVLLHIDASYSLGKLYAPFKDLPIDYLTFSGDRIHSVKGSGGLFAKAGRPLSAWTLGATTDIPSLLALSAAAAQAMLLIDSMNLEVARLRDRFEEMILRAIPDAKVCFANSLRLPNLSAISFPRAHNEALHYVLHRQGLSSAIGGTHAPHIHRLLMASGVPETTAQTAISFALSRYTTQEEVDLAASLVIETVAAQHLLSEDLCL
jgi:cysteine desulfurase